MRAAVAASTSVDGIRAEARTASRTTFIASVKLSSYWSQAVVWAPYLFLKIAEPQSTTAKPVSPEELDETGTQLVTWVAVAKEANKWPVVPGLYSQTFQAWCSAV